MDLGILASHMGIEGFMSSIELDALVTLAMGRDVLEVGSYKGLTAWAMGLTAKSLLCVDTFRSLEDGQTQAGEHTTLKEFTMAVSRYSPDRVHAIMGKSEDAAKVVTDTFDMIFIDANHQKEYVLTDYRVWRPKLREGGFFVFHDYGAMPGVAKATDEVFGPASPEDVCGTLRLVRFSDICAASGLSRAGTPPSSR